ncbi:ABC transporter substrate-binding protein [Rhizobium halophytocola]|uniref:Branched-chain amino acid transport system substrate-binding protein n=1 Tax=Rhizobium halophytocola TaxID=735519 RepID=A0ABS4E2C7_9HYPH|nr:ABC transporter substrate-binding protein [Rhizobium halophytocola]MBP1852084.1 branched-chain amino acid transport system substrate-binding protein [Rhizobium halophytocola]
MTDRHFLVNRRRVLTGAAAGAASMAAPGFWTRALAAPKTIKIGLVQPQTGPLAFFTEHMPFVLEQVKKTTGGQVTINGTQHPFEIIIKDSQSNPNRASEVTQELILQEEVDLIATYATPETVNPVSDQCEINGVPCISNDAPLEPYFFGRNGDPATGWEWTYNFFFSGQELAETLVPYWKRLKPDGVIGGLWPNDGDGIAQSDKDHGFPPFFEKQGFKVVDPGRFDMPASNYNAQIGAFKSAGVNIIQGVLPPPEFTTFWNGAAQQGFRPDIVYVGKACEFPSAMEPLGERAYGLTVEVWWSKFHPYVSGLTGQSSLEICDAYEAASGRQWSLPLGFRHSLFEIVLDTLKRTENPDDKASIRDALKATKYKSIVGEIDFSKGPFPNTALTPLVIGQWTKGGKYPLELVIVDNTTTPEVPVNAEPTLIQY